MPQYTEHGIPLSGQDLFKSQLIAELIMKRDKFYICQLVLCLKIQVAFAGELEIYLYLPVLGGPKSGVLWQMSLCHTLSCLNQDLVEKSTFPSIRLKNQENCMVLYWLSISQRNRLAYFRFQRCFACRWLKIGHSVCVRAWS